jgi:hypothetical protein
VDFRFPIVKLLDYQSRWSELEESQNPFAIVVMAHLKTKETKKDLPARKEWKFTLTRMLYEREYEREDIINLFRFLDWILEQHSGQFLIGNSRIRVSVSEITPASKAE